MLQGSFDTVSLDEVLGFLASSSKVGYSESAETEELAQSG